MTLITRRSLIASAAALTGAAIAAPVFAQAAPIVVYDDELKNGWQSWSWAKVEMSVPIGGAKPMKVEGDPWQALALHHDPISMEGYSKLTFFINGGIDGGQSIAVKLLVDGKAVDSNYILQPKTKQWLPASVPLKDIGGAGKMVDGIWFQGQAAAFKPYYIDKIQFEA